MTYKQLLLNSIKVSTEYIQENLSKGYMDKTTFSEISNEVKRILNDVKLLQELKED